MNHTSISSYSELNVFKKIWFVGVISNRLPDGLLGTNVYKTLKSCWQWLLIMLQWTNTTSVVSKCGTFSPFLSLVILFSVLPSNFTVLGVKSSKLYPFLILTVILFSILFTCICINGLSVFSPCFLKYTQKYLDFFI